MSPIKNDNKSDFAENCPISHECVLSAIYFVYWRGGLIPNIGLVTERKMDLLAILRGFDSQTTNTRNCRRSGFGRGKQEAEDVEPFSFIKFETHLPREKQSRNNYIAAHAQGFHFICGQINFQKSLQF